MQDALAFSGRPQQQATRLTEIQAQLLLPGDRIKHRELVGVVDRVAVTGNRGVTVNATSASGIAIEFAVSFDTPVRLVLGSQ